MLAINSNNDRDPRNNLKPAKPKQNPASKGEIKTRSTTKKSVIGVSNISVSIRSSKKASDSSKTKSAPHAPSEFEVTNSDVGVQVDEVEIIANDCGEKGDATIFKLPSAKVIREIEKMRQHKKDMQLKARLSETRKFEEHSAKQEVHLDNLKQFIDTGAITRKREVELETGVGDSAVKAESNKTKNAVEAYDRIKQKEEELMKLFNSI